MKQLAVLFAAACVLCLTDPLHAAERFGRHVVALENPKDYQYFRLDDVNYPMLSSPNYSVSCLVYRGTENYYVEVTIQNRSANPITIPADFVEFTKPGYSVFRANIDDIAKLSAGAANEQFIPNPPPQMPARSTTTTRVNATATTNGNTTQVNGTATSTTRDSSGQASANLGYAIGTAIPLGLSIRPSVKLFHLLSI
jgi:hypothetical protein